MSLRERGREGARGGGSGGAGGQKHTLHSKMGPEMTLPPNFGERICKILGGIPCVGSCMLEGSRLWQNIVPCGKFGDGPHGRDATDGDQVQIKGKDVQGEQHAAERFTPP